MPNIYSNRNKNIDEKYKVKKTKKVDIQNLQYRLKQYERLYKAHKDKQVWTIIIKLRRIIKKNL